MLAGAPVLHFSMAVDDLDRSIGFYESCFGFTPTLPPTDIGDAFARLIGVPGIGARLAQLGHRDRGETLELIAISEPGGDPRPAVPKAHVALQVTDLDAAVDAAQAAGAEQMGETVTFEEGRSAYLREPGGSVIELEELFHG